MSRIGRAPIQIPAGVTVTRNGDTFTVKGPKGELTRTIDKLITSEIKDGYLVFSRPNEEKESKAKHGLYRALVNNMVVGVTKGFEKSLIINGVGYRAAVAGDKLTLNIGYSRPVEVIAPKGIKFDCPTTTEIVVSGIDKELVGQVAADIKAKRVVEPYHAYGVRYKTETVVLKEITKGGK